MNSGFKYYPEKLHTGGALVPSVTPNTGKFAVRMTPVHISNKMYGMSKPQEVFYSVKDGNWTDITMWETVSGRVGRIPSNTGLDDVYIRHRVTIDIAGSSTATINNLFVSGTLLMTTGGSVHGLTVLGNIQATGTIDWTGSITTTLTVFGNNNYISNYIHGNSTFTYARLGNQDIMPLSYYNLTLAGSGTKSFTSDLTILNTFTTSLSTGGMTELMNWNLTVNGTTSLNSTVFSKRSSGSMLFIGMVTSNATMAFSEGNPTVECRGGLSFSSAVLQSGTGAWNFTTNAQNITFSNGTYQFNGEVTVVGAIAVTNVSSNGIMQINNSLDNDSASGSFINKGNLYWNNASDFDFTQGTFDKDNFSTNIVGYIFNGSATLPYTTYQGLYIAGTGTKTAAGVATMGTTLTIATGARMDAAGTVTVGTTLTTTGTAFLELYTYNLTVTGASNIQGTLSKTGAGSVVFTGLFTWASGAGANLLFTGNPSVQTNGGITIGNFGNSGTWNAGTGTWTVVGSQTWSMSSNSNAFAFYDVLISGAITLTITGPSGGNYQINNSITGNNASSALLMGASGKLWFNTSTIMTTGTFDASNITSIVGYIFNGDYTLPFTTYGGLVIGGTGIKTVGGTTSLSLASGNGLIINVGATFELSTFDLTVTASSGVAGTLSKTGTGSVIFIGVQTLSAASICNLTGNPSVEYRGGLTLAGSNVFNGAAIFTFTTNNQALTHTSGTLTIPYDILISGAITLTKSIGVSTVFTGIINGNNAASTFDNRGTVEYKNATAPMATGVLTCNAAANTWKYNAAGAQDVQGGTTHLTGGQYRTLELGGSGAKRLLGNVDWVTAYSLTGTATLDNNGFTLS